MQFTSLFAMRNVLHNGFLLLFWGTLSLSLPAQVNTDCETAIVICTDDTFRFKPQGAGKDDFENPNNSEGCLQERERLSAWYYFEFRADMPPNSEIEFTILPLRGGNTDFDFAIYGADLQCDSLGSPLRCSFADPNNTVTASDSTGLRPFVYRRNALGQVIEEIPQLDESEGRLTDELGRAADGFVAPMVVQPTQGFYLLLDFFQRDFEDTLDFIDFQLTWGGSAAPYLNCIANPRCIDAFAEAGPDQQVCAGDPDLQLQGAAFNTNGGETYVWEGTNGATAYLDDPTVPNPKINLPPGFSGDILFRFKAVEGACVKDDSMRLEVLPSPVPGIAGDSILCPDEAGNLTAQSGFSDYRWSDGVTGANRPIAGPGTYRVSVTDGDGCPGVNSITVGEYAVPPAVIDGDEGFCPGETAELTAGEGFSSYRWSTGETGPAASVTAAGTYTVTVTTADGCETTASADVLAYAAPAPAIDGLDYFCEGGFTTLDAGVFSSYRWQDGRETRRIRVEEAGTYTVEVTNAEGCAADVALDVRETPNPAPVIEGDTAFCGGASTLLSVPGEFAAVAWSTGATGPELTVGTAGDYAVTVTDALGCSGQDVVRVDTIPIPRPIITGDRGICPGSEAILRLGGNFETFVWSTGGTGPTLTVGTPGTYYVTVTVAENCEAIDSVEVMSFDAPTPSITGPEYFCEGETVVLDAGVHSRYLWDDGEETRTITVDEPGTYSVVVNNENGCPEVATKTLREIPLPEPVIMGDATICSGSSTILDAGLGYASYRWSGGEQSRGLSVSLPGTYEVVVTDSLGCSGQAGFTVDTLPTPRPRIEGPDQLCIGDSIFLDAGAGYSIYRWSTGASQPVIRVRTGGTYALTVTNEVGCSAQTARQVTAVDRELPALRDDYSLCSGDSLVLDPGDQFLDYRWSDNSTGSSLTVAAGGEYRVTVTDRNGCVNEGVTTVQEFTVEPPVIQGQSEFCSGQQVSLFVGGGYARFRWSTQDTTSMITIRRGGAYAVTVADRNGCAAETTRTILEKESPLIGIEGVPAFCEGDSTVLSVAGGYPVYTWSDGRITPRITVTEPGFYGIVVRADNGCITRDEIEVVENGAPLPAIGATLDYCPEDFALLDAGPGFSTYRWSTGETAQVLEVAEPGIYSVTVTDDIGCTGSAQTIVRQLTPPNPAIQTRQFLCEGTTTTLRADANFESFRWSTGDTTLTIEVARPGEYVVTVTDDRGCSAAKTIELAEVAAPQFEVSGPRHFCSGEAITLGVEAIFPEIVWSTGSTRRSTTVQSPGTYSVTVTNSAGCTTLQTLAVEEIPNPVADAGAPAVLDCRIPAARLGGPGTTNGDRFAYRWSGPGIDADNATLMRPEVASGGSYQLQVVDTVYGCASPFDTVQIEDRRFTPALTLAATDTLDCRTDSVRLVVDVPQPLSSMVYHWEGDDGEPLRPADPLAVVVDRPGTYRFMVIDTLSGCSNQLAAPVVEDREAPFVSAGIDRQLDCRNQEVLLDASATSTGPEMTYEWTTDSGSFSDRRNPLGPLVSAPGWYVLQVRNDRNGCQGLDSVQVVRDLTAPLIEATVSERLDCDVPEVWLQARNLDSSQVITYQWKGIDDLFFSAEGEQATVQRAGQYRLIAINGSTGCPTADTVEVLQNENLPQAIEWEARPTTCFGDTDGVLTVLGIDGGEGPYLYALNGGGLMSEPRFTNLDAGVYDLTIQDLNGCELTVPVTVGEGNDLSLDVGEDRTIALGDSTALEAVISIPDDAVASFLWTEPGPFDCESCQVIVVSPLRKTLYKAFVEDLNGCVAVDSVEIDVVPEDRIYIPTAFSPNGDGNNDSFMIFSGNDVARINYLKIFSRWGETVYENDDFLPNDPQHAWDGRHRGRPLNPAVFVYLAEIEFINGEVKIFKGDVTLLR